MRNFLFYFIFSLFFNCLKSQKTRFIVEFKDKIGSPYSINNPSDFLSQKSIERRIKQGIQIEENDLPPNPEYIHEILKLGAKFIHKSRWFNSATFEIKEKNILEKINQLKFVKCIKESKKNTISLPDDFKFHLENYKFSSPKQSGLNLSNDVFNYGFSAAQINQIGGICLHNQGFDGYQKVICVLDAGFKNADTLSCFDSLRTNGQILGTWDFVDNEASVYEDNDHGAMVLSCMASNSPSLLVGAAPKASYWLLRTENAGSELISEEINWAAGAEFADSVGADIINSSLGYTLFDSSLQNHTWADLDGNTAIATKAADIAASKGIIVCNSAGNEGSGSWKYISVPADADSILTIGAVDINGVRAGFSGVGPTADDRIKPDVAANGNGTYLIAPWSGSVTQSGGTSFSSPLIAGMTACLWQANPNKSNMEIISAIKSSGNQASNPDTLLGWGIPNFCLANATLNGIEYLSPKNQDEINSIFYNPDEGVFSMYYYSHNGNIIDIVLTELNGKILLLEQRKVKKGNINFFKIENASSLSTGIYILTILSSENKISRKIFKY